MGKKNSKEAKLLRREKINAKRKEKSSLYADPCPRPDSEYLKHYGFVPNINFFRNAAVAWSSADMNIALRTKQQVIDYVKEGSVELLGTRSGQKVVYISLFKTGDYKSTGSKYNPTMDTHCDNEKAYYMVRHPEHLCSSVNGKPDMEVFRLYCPFFDKVNTFMVPVDRMEELLTDKAATTEELVAIAKWDEAVQPLNEQELDNLLGSFEEHMLREYYEFNENGLIIEEFLSEEGETMYQPKKKDSTWEQAITAFPFMVNGNSIVVPRPKAIKTFSLLSGEAN